jgi:hypothetical protein
MNIRHKEELNGTAVSALWRAIADVKQCWSVFEWVTKNLLSRALSCSEGTLRRWFRLHLQSLAPTNPHWARVVVYGPFCVIHKEGLCPAVGTLIGWWRLWWWDTRICQFTTATRQEIKGLIQNRTNHSYLTKQSRFLYSNKKRRIWLLRHVSTIRLLPIRSSAMLCYKWWKPFIYSR